ncbi:hypothetical protein SLEP1_g23456 [Rubroshorea leprosula]|uniref:ATP synthase F0 subunit 8 n=1 Tax=Rubroshorea leprosula TaxID=152421 RepID=A0AAV5JLQ4_9ROSI|nr:hypothetical protein SLEP1_g23456 [Rubroshorea leprosula]
MNFIFLALNWLGFTLISLGFSNFGIFPKIPLHFRRPSPKPASSSLAC